MIKLSNFIQVYDRLSRIFQNFLHKKQIISAKLPNSRDLWKPFLKKLNNQKLNKFLIDLNIESLKLFMEYVNKKSN